MAYVFSQGIVAVGVEPTRHKQCTTTFESANSTRRSVFRLPIMSNYYPYISHRPKLLQ
nr:MAG TPA: hypothetical protein [Bacteriophage sp.]